MIKVLHLITDLDTGGSEMMLYKLLSKIDRNEFINSVVSMTNKGTIGPLIEDMNINVYALGIRRGVLSPFGLFRFMSILQKEKPDLIQTWLYHADFLGMIGAKIMAIPVVWNIRCSDMELNKYSRLTALVVKICKHFSGATAGIIVNSSAGKLVHLSLGYHPTSWIIIPNGFDLAKFTVCSDNKKSVIRQNLGVAENNLVIGTVARYDPMKDYSNLIEAIRLFVKSYSQQVTFIMVGRDVNNENKEFMDMILKAGIKENVLLLGERTDIPEIMQSLDVYCSPSCSEGFPNAVGEAMSCGIICVVTDTGDSAIIVGDTGKVVPTKNPEALSSALLAIARLSPENRRELGLKARRRIEENYSLPAVTKQYEKIYKEIIANVRDNRSV